MARTRHADAPLPTRIRYDLTRMGLGVLALTPPQKTQEALRRYYAVIDKLIADDQVEVLRELIAGRASLPALVDLDRHGKLRGSEILALAMHAQPLFRVWDAAVARGALGRGPAAQRYAITRQQLERKAARWLTPATTLEDLTRPDRVPWGTIAAQWDASAADWNHVRKAVSRVLSVVLGDRTHPFRRRIVAQIPRRPEPPRMADVNAALFWAILAHVREDLRPAYLCLAATGMRVGEYLRCERAHLLEHARALRIPGTKTAHAPRLVAIDARLWPWVDAAIPSPLKYKALRAHWCAARAAAGAPSTRLHDLRHLHAQLASDEGKAVTAIAASLGHAQLSTTWRYARTTDTRHVSHAVADALLSVQSVHCVNLTSPDPVAQLAEQRPFKP